MSALSDGDAHASAARPVAHVVEQPLGQARGRSRIWSPIATPTRGASSLPARRNTPNGRFWIGKSVAGSCADSTQDWSGMWVVQRVVTRRLWLGMRVGPVGA